MDTEEPRIEVKHLRINKSTLFGMVPMIFVCHCRLHNLRLVSSYSQRVVPREDHIQSACKTPADRYANRIRHGIHIFVPEHIPHPRKWGWQLTRLTL